MVTPNPLGIVVFSGGSAANNLVDVFNRVTRAKDCTLSYVMPISDNGGSSSELIRVFGGPGNALPPMQFHRPLITGSAPKKQSFQD